MSPFNAPDGSPLEQVDMYDPWGARVKTNRRTCREARRVEPVEQGVRCVQLWCASDHVAQLVRNQLDELNYVLSEQIPWSEKVETNNAAARSMVAIVDLGPSESNGLNVVRFLRSNDDDLPVLVLAERNGLLDIEKSFQAGARGYIQHKDIPEVLNKAIAAVCAGGIYLRSSLDEQFLLTRRSSLPVQPLSKSNGITSPNQ